MTIRLKIFALVTLLLLLFGVAVGISMMLQEQVNDEIGAINDYHLPITAAVVEIDVITFEYELLLNRMLHNPVPDADRLATVAKRGREIIASLNQSFNLAKSLLTRAIADERNDLQDRLILSRIHGTLFYLRRQVGPFEDLGLRILEAYASGTYQEAQTLATGFAKFEEVFGPDLAAVRKDLTALTQASMAETKVHETLHRRFSIGLFVLAALIGLGISALLAARLVRALRQLLEGTRAVQVGEPTHALPVTSRDEVGQLTRAFNYMIEELHAKERIKDTFGKYVDPRIVANLINTPDGEVDTAERRIVTVFFSDIKGFSSICEQLTAAVMVNLLNYYFTAVTDAIRAHRGIIDKYIGDSVMAFWAPPFSTGDDHAAEACVSALAQQTAIVELRKELPNIVGLRRNVPDFQVRMGLATGEVVIGTVGSPSAKSYTVIGDIVNLASRLEGTNKLFGTSICISEDTNRLAQQQVETRELDLVTVAGKTEPVRIFEVMARVGDLDTVAAALRDRFAEGLTAYRRHDWDTAEAIFSDCLERRPDDGPSKLFKQRIARLRAAPPPTDWDGVWQLTEK